MTSTLAVEAQSDEYDQQTDCLVGKAMMVSGGLPPAVNGSTSIITNLAAAFSRSEMVLVGEQAPGPQENCWNNDDLTVPRLFYVHKRWPWMFKRTVRLLCFPLIFFRMLRIYRREQCTQVIAVFPNEFYLFCGWLLSKITGDPLHAYFHNTYLENRKRVRRWFARFLQPRVFCDSRVVFVMSDGMKTYLKEVYPEASFVPLLHSFHGEVDRVSAKSDVPDDFQVAFMGNLNLSNREAMGRLRGVLDRYPNCRLVTYSGVPDSHFTSLNLTGPRITNTRVGYDEVVGELRKSDLLFLPHGFVGGLKPVEYETIFPTRTIPYLLSGIPIIAHSPPNSFLTRWLAQHDCAEIVDDPSVESICQAIDRLRHNGDRRSEIVRNAFRAVEQFQITRVAECFRQVVNGSGA